MEEKRNEYEDKKRQEASEERKGRRLVQERQKMMERQITVEHRMDEEAAQ